jgi:opacity protein-like surface antigen
MNKLLLGAAAAAALLAPAAASAETNAVIGLDYNTTNWDIVDYDNYGLNGAFNHDFANGWQVQMDGRTGRTDVSGCCISEGYGAVHYGTRTSDYSYAGFLGMQQLFFYSGLSVGVEGQLHFSNASIGGSVSYVDFSDLDLSGTNVQANGLYYFTPDFSVGADVDYIDSDIDDWTTWGIGGEYRFAGSPTSITLSYHQSDFEGDPQTWSIGVNFDLGTGSLQDRRVHGPSWDGASSLNSGFGRLPPIA